jgi:hypothetical protein
MSGRSAPESRAGWLAAGTLNTSRPGRRTPRSHSRANASGRNSSWPVATDSSVKVETTVKVISKHVVDRHTFALCAQFCRHNGGHPRVAGGAAHVPWMRSFEQTPPRGLCSDSTFRATAVRARRANDQNAISISRPRWRKLQTMSGRSPPESCAGWPAATETPVPQVAGHIEVCEQLRVVGIGHGW